MRRKDILSNIFENYIHDHQLFKKDDRIMLAVSGGLDSMVLLDLVYNLGFKPIIAHVNYNLRKESVLDRALVLREAKKKRLQVFIKDVEKEDYSNIPIGSIQMKARDIRYQWFSELVKTHKIDYVLTAHHLNDNVETQILNMSRGTGIRGLRGMLNKNGNIVRPLLFARQQQLTKYANQFEIQFNEDVSNRSLKYERNYIRHEIIGRIEKLNPSFLHTSSLNFQRFLGLEMVLDEKMKEIKSKFVKQKNSLTYISKKFHNSSQYRSLILFELLKSYGFSFAQILELVSIDQSGKKIQNDRFLVLNDRKHWIIGPLNLFHHCSMLIEKEGVYQFKDSKIEVRKVSKDTTSEFDKNALYLDMQIARFPITVRTWLAGDFFYPFGMKGKKKKLKKYFSDEKVNVFEKSRLPLVIVDNKIAGIISKRSDRRFKIDTKTEEIMKISWIQN